MREIPQPLSRNPTSRDVKGNKRGFYKSIGDKRKTGGNVGPLLNETGHGMVKRLRC